LLLRDLQPLPPPDPFDPLHVHDPAGVTQQGRDPPIAVAAILGCERDDVRGERLLVGAPARHLPLGRSMLAEHTAGEAVHKGESYPCEHDVNIDRKKWNRVHAILQESPRKRVMRTRDATPALLKELLFGPDGA
jgi:hypothetical protein